MTDVRNATDFAERVASNASLALVANEPAIHVAVLALLCKGHVLIEGLPGAGKTLLARTLARSLSGSFKRIQCTADMLPSDVTGSYIFNQRDQDFQFRAGPIMANIVLVDEINRATPRTQSALLEAMEERQVTVDGVTHLVPEPFLVLATRNPVDDGGTFPLPGAAVDRFTARIALGYPTPSDEEEIVARHLERLPVERLQPVADLNDLAAAQEAVSAVYVDPPVTAYAVALVNAARADASVRPMVSPRATLALVELARAHAVSEGRDFTTPHDVKAVADAALSHRVSASWHDDDAPPAEHVVRAILERVNVEQIPRRLEDVSAVSGPGRGARI